MKRVGVASVFLLTLGLTAAQTNLSQGLLECSAVTAEDERLACYDRLADDAVPAKAVAAENWNLSVDTNPVDDSKTVTAITEATEESVGVGLYDENFALILRCQSGELEAYIRWNEFLGSDTTQITYRIGTAAAVTDTWYISTDGTAAFYSVNEPANTDFIRKLEAADNGRLVAQVTPYSESTYTAIFNVSGLSNIAPQLYETCA